LIDANDRILSENAEFGRLLVDIRVLGQSGHGAGISPRRLMTQSRHGIVVYAGEHVAQVPSR